MFTSTIKINGIDGPLNEKNGIGIMDIIYMWISVPFVLHSGKYDTTYVIEWYQRSRL